MDKEIEYIVGIDEVGRGPIAGPVCAASFKLPIINYQLLIKNAQKEIKIPLRDSKKLNKRQREKWFDFLSQQKKKGNCDFAVSFVLPENIDKFGISKCIQKALDESLKNVISRKILSARFFDEGGRGATSPKEFPARSNSSPLDTNHYKLFLDGGLKAREEFIHQETIIKGDELHPVISLASIVAKVSRDKVMEKFAKVYPNYGFEKHVGYGTKAHYEAIKKYGQTPIHRKSFIH